MEDFSTALFPFAYNITGSVEDARDVVQDVLAAHHTAPPAGIANEKAYLIRSTINRAVNAKKRLQRTVREGDVWLPEPIATDDAADRNLHLEDILSYSLLVLMERLSATERAAFILRESFDYSHAEIAGVLDISEEHSRKLLSRAKSRLFKPAPKRTAAQDVRDRSILEGYLGAIRQRDVARLESLMAADIRLYADGGGKVPVLATSCAGAAAVAALQMVVYERYLSTTTIVYAIVNHQPALLSFKDGRLHSCQVFDLHPETGAVLQIAGIIDPGKLQNLHPQTIV